MAETEVDKSCFLYMITNKVNCKSYIGVSNNPKRRMREHIYEDRPNSNPHIKAAINKYGPENFEMKILCEGSREYIYDLEAKAIDLYDTLNRGYNLAPGGRGGMGKKITKRSDDYACFVYGFWFPNKRTACSAMRITNSNVFYKQRKEGSLGDVCRVVKGSVSGNPIYYRGLWFENAKQVSEIIGRPISTILADINKGKIEENTNTSSKHPERVPIIDGVIYNSFEEASDMLGVSKYTLKSRFYIGTEGYSYQYIIKE